MPNCNECPLFNVEGHCNDEFCIIEQLNKNKNYKSK